MAKAKRPNGRPGRYTKALADRICLRLAEGESLNSICKDPKIASKSIVYRWLLDSKLKDFRDNYARARAMQAEQMADELLEIADDAINDWMDKTYGDETVRVVDHEAINRSRLRVDTRKFLLSKLLPKKYGDDPKPDMPEEQKQEKPHEATTRIIESEPLPERYKADDGA